MRPSGDPVPASARPLDRGSEEHVLQGDVQDWVTNVGVAGYFIRRELRGFPPATLVKHHIN